MWATMPEKLLTAALQRALLAQAPTPNLVVHSDRGSQYCGNAYKTLLHEYGVLHSQSRRGDCYGNTQAESRWPQLRTEALELRDWPVGAAGGARLLLLG